MTKVRNPDYMNYDNGSQFPFGGGGVYLGKVLAVDAGNRVTVKIPSLGLTLNSCPVVGTTKVLKPMVDDTVACAFLENDNQEVVVIGRINIALEVYATKAELLAVSAQLSTLSGQLSSLSGQISALDGRVSALENP